MLNTLFLVALTAALVGYLWCRRTPRPIAFEAVFISAWIYTIGFWVALDVVDKLRPDLLFGLVPYIPPIIPVIIFVAWFLRRARVVHR